MATVRIEIDRPEIRITVKERQAFDEVTATPSFRTTFGLNDRTLEALRVIRKVLQSLGATSIRSAEASISALVPKQASPSLEPALIEICGRIALIAERPLTPKMVDSVLGITSAERLRWTKDGRLRVTRHGSIRTGRQQVRVVQFCPDSLARIASDPDNVVRWREMDAAHLNRADRTVAIKPRCST